MVWTSTTRVTRVGGTLKETVWKQVENEGKRYQDLRTRICCFALQGCCRFGNACEYSHDVSKGKTNGCHFGDKCQAGHIAPETNPPRKHAGDAGRDLDNGLFVAAQAFCPEEAKYAESIGIAFDGTDPLWEELCLALVKPDEDIGDSDLNSSVRKRLSAESVYWLLDEDTSDEWLCLPSIPLQTCLEAVQNRCARTRHNWLTDDLIDARVLWETLSGVLSRRTFQTKEVSSTPDKNFSSTSTYSWSWEREEDDERLDSAAEQIAPKMQRVFELGPKLEPVPKSLDSTALAAAEEAAVISLTEVLSSGFGDAVETALNAMDELVQSCQTVRAQRLQRYAKTRKDGEGFKAEKESSKRKTELWGHPLNDELRVSTLDESELHSFRAEQLLRCLNRCLYVCHSFRAGRKSANGGGALGSMRKSTTDDEEGTAGSPLVQGAHAEVVGLTAPAERQLNGQVGQLEAHHADLGLWRLRLPETDTRLLLAPEHLAKAPPSMPDDVVMKRHDRSRSPRRYNVPSEGTRQSAGHFATLLDVVRKAAIDGEHILVHHDVSWSED